MKYSVKRWRLGILGIVVSLAAVYFVLSQIDDLRQVETALRDARYIYLVPTIALLVAGLVTRAFRWRVLLNGQLPLRRAFSIMNVAYLVNGILPLRIGEVARIYLSTQASPPVPALQTASTIVVERLLDLLGVVVMVALGIGLAQGSVPDLIRRYAISSAVVAVAGFICLVVLASRRQLARRLVESVLQRFARTRQTTTGERLLRWLEHFLDGLLPLTQPRALMSALVWTLMSWGFSTAAGYVLMFTFYAEANLAVTMLYIAAAAFAIAVPAAPGNLGPYELSILLVLGAMGYGEPSGTATAFAVTVHFVNLAVHATTGVLGFMQEGVSMGQLFSGVQRMREQQIGM